MVILFFSNRAKKRCIVHKGQYINRLKCVHKIREVASLAPHDINPPLWNEDMASETRLGSDSHAGTYCVNKHVYIETVIEGITVDAIPFDTRIGKLTDHPIVYAIFAVDNTTAYKTNIIRLNNSIYICDMDHFLLCPNQVPRYDILSTIFHRTLIIPECSLSPFLRVSIISHCLSLVL